MTLTYGYHRLTGEFIITVKDRNGLRVKEIVLQRADARRIAKKIEFGKKGDEDVIENFLDT